MELTPDNASLRTTEGQLRLSLISNIFFTPHFLLSAPCFSNLILKTILYQNPHRRIYFPIGNKTCFLFVLSCKEAMCPARYEGYGLYSIEASDMYFISVFACTRSAFCGLFFLPLFPGSCPLSTFDPLCCPS